MHASAPLGASMGKSGGVRIGGAPSPLSLAEVEAFDPQGGRGPEHGRRWRCPLCQAKERSLSVNTATGAYNCKRASCGVRGLLLEHRTHDAQGLQGRSYRAQAKARALANVFSLGTSAAPVERLASTWRESLSQLEPLAETSGAKYLASRGIAPELAQACGVRFAATWAPRGEGTAIYRAGVAVVFPMRDRSGALVAANGRYLSPDATPKTRTGGTSGLGAFAASVQREAASDARLSPLEAPAVILCEGPMDALSLAACGYPALAVSGCNLPAWIPAACAFKRVLLASDADASGDEAASTWRQSVRPFAAEVERLRPPHGKDWNEALLVLGRDALAAWLDGRISPVEPEPQVLEPCPPEVSPEAASTCTWPEVLRPDLRAPLGLEALHRDPPEDAPINPAWASPAVWVRDLGVWQRCGGVVVTAATAAKCWARARESKAPQVLAAALSPVEVEPQPSEEHAARLRLAREIGGILEALPGAKRLRSGDWRFEGEVWEHDQAVLLAAQRRGSTSGGWALEVDAGEIYRAHNPNNTEGPQVLEGKPEEVNQ